MFGARILAGRGFEEADARDTSNTVIVDRTFVERVAGGVEGSLYKTLKTAEDTGASVIEQARAAADLHLRESQMQAEALLHEAKTKARNAVEESEMRVKEIVAEMEDKLKALVDQYKSLEGSRDDLLASIKHLASDALDRVERARAVAKEFDPDKHLSKAKIESRKMIFPNAVEFDRVAKPEPAVHREREIILEERTITVESTSNIESPAKKVQRSFFDEIG
jgi:cell division initiation protein